MSLSCLLGMHDIIWNNSSSGSFRQRNHVRGLERVRMSTARSPASSTITPQNIDEFANVLRVKNQSSNNLQFLFRSNGSDNFPGRTSQNGFRADQWSVPDGSQQEVEESGGTETDYSGISKKDSKEKGIQEIMPSKKKIWSNDSRVEKEPEKPMFFQHQWQETPWAIEGETDKSEHAVSQPIMVKQRGNQGFNPPEQQSSVVSPRSADGLGVYGMVEYVLASSPGGGDLEATMKGMDINGTLRVKSPYDDAAEAQPTVLDIQKEQEAVNSHSGTPIQDEESQLVFSRTPGSRQESPNPNSQSSQEGPKSNGYGQDIQIMGKVESASESSLVTSPVQLITQVDPSAIGIETLPFSYGESQLQGNNPEGIVRSIAQQQPQVIIGNAQQQQYGVALASSPYFVTNPPQDPYGNGSISILNANGQPAVIPTQYAPYGMQPWAYANASGNAAYVQQQPQQLQQSQLRTQSNGNRATGEQMIGQQLSTTPTGYQVIPGPLSIPAGATFYDQQGNPVIINGRMAQQLTNPLGQPIRMVSPMVVNNSGQTAVSPQMQSQSQTIQLLNAQQQQQSQQSQQARQQQGSSINLGYLSTGNVGALSALNGVSNVQLPNGGPVGVIGGHLSTSMPSSVAPPIGGIQARRDAFGQMETMKQQNVTQVYPGMVGSYNSLTVNTPLANNLNISDSNTSPIQNQASFNLGSPVNSRFSGYMSLLTAQADRKYSSSASSLVGGSIFGPSTTSIYRKSGRDSGRSKLLEDFRNNRYPNLQLRDLTNHIVEFSQDQHGSRFIQQKLERASVMEKNLVFNEILSAAYSLMTDVFGNYVIQKFFEFGSPEQKMALANRIQGHVLQLALQMYGCRVIQKALESIPQNVQKDLVAELDGHVLKCVKDQNGNHVVQKCIECVDAAHLQFIINAFRGQVFALSTHPYGCRVIQRILEHCSPEQTSPILSELHENTERLVQDQYGNYVIQHVLEHGSPDDKLTIIALVRGNVLQLSQHKFASNVVEKCVSHASRADRAALIDEVCNDANPGALYAMMKDQFANYVVQKMIDVAEPLQKKMLILKIRPHEATLRKFTYGKHILAKLEKLGKSFYLKPNVDMVFLPPNGHVL
ncbi:pumilio homolog 1-like isoform X1 [Rhopilema esculentum]|uniref:pumilio homolog 1-like isoform X1 n=1 Tax=Rhopilema esculentum TaxID=499914 RepID=UPI0031D71AD3